MIFSKVLEIIINPNNELNYPKSFSYIWCQATDAANFETMNEDELLVNLLRRNRRNEKKGSDDQPKLSAPKEFLKLAYDFYHKIYNFI